MFGAGSFAAFTFSDEPEAIAAGGGSTVPVLYRQRQMQGMAS